MRWAEERRPQHSALVWFCLIPRTKKNNTGSGFSDARCNAEKRFKPRAIPNEKDEYKII